MQTTPVFNPFEPGYIQDPYAHYRALREAEPVHESMIGAFVCFRHAEVQALLSDHSASVDFHKMTPTPLMETVRPDRLEQRQRSMLDLDPPDHTRLRKLVSKAFTPRAIGDLRVRVQELVDQALDAVAPSGRMDVISDLAFPLPFTVISEMLGMPMDRREELRDWSGHMVKTLDPVITEEELDAAYAAGDKMRLHVRKVIEDKRSSPSGDMLSALIEAEEHGDVLSDEELVSQVILIYLAGHETTVNLIGNGTLALLRNPLQMDRLRSQPSLIGTAVEELLRYDSPVQFSRRILTVPLRLGSHDVEAGRLVMLGLGAANHDPDHFGPDADALDITRTNAADHVSFGGGRHFCLGAALARLEGQVAIGTLVSRFQRLALDGEPVWNNRINLRGLSILPVKL